MNRELLNNSVVGRDFLNHLEHPDNDVFLDYRNRLRDMKKNQKYPKAWLENEIKAVDEILGVLNNDNSES